MCVHVHTQRHIAHHFGKKINLSRSLLIIKHMPTKKHTRKHKQDRIGIHIFMYTYRHTSTVLARSRMVGRLHLGLARSRYP